ncbi:MAG: ATP-binding protein [Legionella sp.]|uniref:ATP-binding protein n=1 Tax=Legionella sp. TaxID=459 RepID=UPI0039E2552E
MILKTQSPRSKQNKEWEVISRYVLATLTSNSSNTEGTHQDIYQYMENIIAEIPISVYWMNTEHIYLGCSNDMAKLLHLKSRHDIVGKTYHDLYDEQSAAHYKKADQEVIQTGVSLSVEEPMFQPDGTQKTYLSKKVPLKNAQGTIIGMLGISVNITERITMEKELERAKEAAEAANQAKTEFIANMSHDIRTPLTDVIGLSEILEQTLQNEQDKEKAHMLHDSGEELLHMLNEILDDVRAGNLRETDVKTECFDVHQCIHDLIRLESPATILKHLALKANIAYNVPRYIESDRNKIHRILLNLMGNAIKFTQSGSITLSIECLHRDANKAHLKFSVSDTGIGIPEEAQAQVFNRFFKVSSSYKGIYTGHGLGLHIAQSYVELLGGHITLTSTVGKGSTFHFDVECPIINAPAELEEQPKKVSEAAPETSPLHLLLVEDNIIALKTLEIILEKKRYTFISATSGEEAWALLQTHSVDLIISDIGQLSERIRNQERALNKHPIPIIGLTGHAKETAWEECTRAGMNDVLSKPANINMLERCIRQWSASKGQPNESAPSLTTSLGLDLPDTEEELFQLDAYPLFDEQAVLEQIPDKALLLNLLKTFLSDEMQKDITQMKMEYQEQHWDK